MREIGADTLRRAPLSIIRSASWENVLAKADIEVPSPNVRFAPNTCYW
jgi:hypothetical protein